jgi:hypothetical protein
MEKKKSEVYEFDPVIYPNLVWITVNTKPMEEFGADEMPDYAHADTGRTYRRSDGEYGVLLRFRSKSLMTPSVMAHESIHAALFILDYVGIQINAENSEPLTYLAGWITECCQKVRNCKLSHENNE